MEESTVSPLVPSSSESLLSAQSCTFVFINFFASNETLCCDSPHSWLVWFMAYNPLTKTLLSLWEKILPEPALLKKCGDTNSLYTDISSRI